MQTFQTIVGLICVALMLATVLLANANIVEWKVAWLVIAVFATAVFVRALLTGKVESRGGSVLRADDPIGYWVSMVLFLFVLMAGWIYLWREFAAR